MDETKTNLHQEDFSLQEVLAACRRVAGAVALTPCRKSPGLSQFTGCQVYCKAEYTQPTGSFKERGARNALSLLAAQPPTLGVIAASAGNRALGLASALSGPSCPHENRKSASITSYDWHKWGRRVTKCQA